METETKKHQRFTKRREREKKHSNGSCDDQDDSPSRSDKRTKPRRKKNNTNFIEEDIVDGFAIISFKTFEDLENAVKNSMNLKPGLEKKSNTQNNREKPKHNVRKKDRNRQHNRVNSPPPTPPLVKPNLEENLDCSPRSDQTEVLDLQLNGDQANNISLSDASSHSSSGRGYLCDSESGDERASDASSDIFTAVNRSRECHIPNTTACSSPCVPTAVTTTTTLTSSVTPTVPSSSVTTTTATTTTSALSVAAATTNSITTTTSSCSSAARTPITTASVIYNGPKVSQAPPPPPVKHHPHPVSSSPVQHPTLPASRPSSVSASHRDLAHKSSSPLLSRTPKREDYRDKDTPLPASSSFNKHWGSANSSSSHQLYSPQISPSAGLSSFHSTPNHTPTFHQHTPLLPHPPSAHTPGHPSHSMFAPPLPPGPAAGSLSSGSLGGAAAHSPGDSMSFANQEILREELNRRFLATQDRPSASSIGAPPYMRTDIHQHQHQHMHQHQHTHQHMYPIPFSASLGPPPAPLLYEKVPKLSDSPFYRQGIPGLPAYPADISPLLPPAGRGPLNSGIPGAFQPKRIASSIHPAQMRLAPIRDLDKATPSNPVATLPSQKKTGKWCAVHVRIAWEIYQHQQKHSDSQKGSETASKSMDPLRPPSHLLPINSSIHKPPDLNPASALLASASHRNLLESNPHLLGSSNIGVSPFPRPSPYSIGASALGSFGGLGSGPFSGTREMPTVPGITPPHEWNRLHRTPPSFPTPTSWPKQLEDREKEREKELEREREREKEKELEREREKEREKEKEREAMFGTDRRREEERERERIKNERERLGLSAHGLLDRSRERERLLGHSDIRPSRSRSRSRSPLQNGRVSSAKSNSSYEREIDNKNNILKIKEERRDEEILHAERERENKLRNEYLFGSMPNPSNPLSMFDRNRLLGQSSFLPDRVPPHPALWSHFDKSPLDFNHHRLQLQQDMERERERMISRLQHPVTTLQALEQDRLRKEELMLQDERFRREYFERLPLYERERLAAIHEQQSRLGLRPGDITASHFQRTISPMLNHTGPKGGSPACAPPPLIPSSSATSRSHSNSPAVGKPKLGIHGSGVVDPLGDKRDTYSNSTDPDSHSR